MNHDKPKGGELFIVDNSDADWKVRQYLSEWADIATKFDIATGYFEIGALLALDGQWQKLEQLRILMGDHVSMRTRKALLAGIENAKSLLDKSIEREKETNDFLVGVPGIVEAITNGKIQCKIYTKEKFHAKAYITHAKQAVVGSTALVGSSNFTFPGMTTNVELNIQIRREVEELQQWFERHWNDAEDISAEVLHVMERHVHDYSPFEVYAKALQEFFRGHEMTVSEWEKCKSKMYPKLDQYQKEGYQAMMRIASDYGGAFLCDGVGLGKTYIGLMIIERLIEHDHKNVALFVPKGARDDVWEPEIERHLRHLRGIYNQLEVFNHTDLLTKKHQYNLDMVRERAQAIVIDEAHHFRNPGPQGTEDEIKSRYWRLFEIAEGKQIYMLTATPVNNHLRDLQHMIELFSRLQPDYFKRTWLGIQSLPGRFRKLEKELEKLVEGGKAKGDEGPDAITNQAEAEQVLWNDDLFRALVVQRSRAYVKKSQEQQGGKRAIFPKRESPKVVEYQLRKTYGRLLDMVEEAFEKDKPLFSLAIYYPLAYYIDPDRGQKEWAFAENRQKEVVRLIRMQFLKRFESSAKAFEFSCETLFIKLLTWVTKHSGTDSDKRRLERWKRQHEELIEYIRSEKAELSGQVSEDEYDEDIIDQEMLDDVEALSPDEYRIGEILNETFLDMDQIATFLNELRKFKPAHDDKLKALVRLLKTDPVLKAHKVLIFSEYMTTARYLRKQLELAGLTEVDEVDSARKDRSDIIRRFAPYYNPSPQIDLLGGPDRGTRVLISTDVLSEGLNLQDATRLINYDLHWNPVRLMQRIGRLDRRLNPEIEARIVADHPDQKDIRGTVAYWNFLPPDELDRLLHLYTKVSKKTLRISKVFGIEGKKLLRPDDDYDALKEFTHVYDGETSTIEEMHLEFQRLLKKHPDLEDSLNLLPGRVFSGKAHTTPGTKAVFFCFALPAPEEKDGADGEKEIVWSEEAGHTKWYLYDCESGAITDEPSDIINIIRSEPATPRHRTMENATLSEIRAKLEKHVRNTYFKQVQAPIGVKASLMAWMELS